MTQEEITKAFENRWRIKGFDKYEVRQLSGEYVAKLCRDFFETGICIGEGEHCQPIPMSAIVKAAEEVACDFDTFWDAYDKKVGKEKCQKLWAKMTGEEKIKCNEYVPLYVMSQPSKQYRKNPETFLRNKCWNDELIYHDNGNKSDDPKDKLASILTP